MGSEDLALESDDELLDQQLQAAQLELDALNELVAEIPSLMEARFRMQLAQQQEMNRHLLQEQDQLKALVAATDQVPPNRRLELRLPEFRDTSPPLPAQQRRPAPSWRQKLHLLFGNNLAVLVLLALVGAGIVSLLVARNRSSAPVAKLTAGIASTPRPPETKGSIPSSAQVPKPGNSAPSFAVQGTPESLIELSANDASWVEVSDRAGTILLQTTLQPGEQRQIRLRSGLEIYSARPELLRFRVDGGDWQTSPASFIASGLLLLTPTSR